MVDDQYLDAFIRESQEAITELNNSLLDLEVDPSNREAMDAIFRSAHTLKYNFGAMGFDDASHLANAIEDLLDEMRQGNVDVTPDLMDLIFASVDEIEAIIDEIKEHGESKIDTEETVSELRAIIDNEETGLGNDDASEEHDADEFLTSATLEGFEEGVVEARVEIGDSDMPGVDAMLALSNIEDTYSILASDPEREAIEDGDFDSEFSLYLDTEDAGTLKMDIEDIAEIKSATVTDVTDQALEETDQPRIKEEVRQSIREDEGIDNEYVDEFIDLLDAKYRDLEFDDGLVSLTRLDIEGFKVIDELDVSIPDRATIIHGRNSKGKSSFIEATRFNLFGRDDDDPLITKPINRNYEKLKTDGYWRKGQRNYLVHREMERNQSYEGHDKPNVIENPENSEHSEAEQRTQSEVDDLIGITPLYEQGFDRFNIFSLFSIISGDLRSFYGWDGATDLIDLLFGIKLTKVDRAIRNELEECKLEDEEQEAKTRLLEYKQRGERINEEIQELRQDQEQVEDQLSEKVERREELDRLLDKSETDSALSAKIDLKDEISDTQSRLQEKEDEFRSVKQEISKLKDETATDEIAPALQEIQQLISLPNRCPVCTRDVDPEQQRRFNDHGDCPLCGKDVPDDRYKTVSEVDEEGEVMEREKRQEELEGLESRQRTLEGEIEFLEEELQEKRNQLEILKMREEQSGFSEYKNEKEKVEQEIEDLRNENTSLELGIDTKKGTLHGVARKVWEWSQIDEERQRKEQRMDALESYQNIISEERKKARRRLKNRLEERMESLLEIFTRGTFANATGVRFDRGDSYSYTIHRTDNTLKSPGLLGQTDAELLLHMLLFHITVLAELEEECETVPLKLLLIDSPYGNGPDDENAADVTDFLLELPEILESYQLIVAMADSNLTGRDKLAESYALEPVEQHI